LFFAFVRHVELERTLAEAKVIVIVEGETMPLSKLYDEALVYASELHRNQVRKGSGIPYIAHLLSVGWPSHA
jgi:(p)ppGpp synthase/HD superfamily hydrolase